MVPAKVADAKAKKTNGVKSALFILNLPVAIGKRRYFTTNLNFA